MNTVIFTETSSGDRTNIMSSFQLWSKDTFLQQIKSRKKYNGRYRYGYLDKGYVNLLKEMSLKEFEEIFDPSVFTTEEVTQLFRKEISEKYGEHKIKKELKSLSKREIIRGHIYEDISGNKWLYLGKVKQETDKTYLKTYISEKKPVKIVEGNGFLDLHYVENKPLSSWADNVEIIKGIKKIVKKLDKPAIELKSEYTFETGKMHYSFSERKVTLTIL